MDTALRIVQVTLEEADIRYPDFSLKTHGLTDFEDASMTLARLALREGRREVFEWLRDRLLERLKLPDLPVELTPEITERTGSQPVDEYLREFDQNVHAETQGP